MPSMKLTQIAVDRIGPPKAGRVEFFDKNLPGFGLRVAASGHKAWTVMYRLPGDPKVRRYTIPFSRYPRVDKARERAREVMRLAESGTDPAATPEMPRKVDTVQSIAEQFIARYAKLKNRSWQETDKLIRRHIVSRWGAKRADSITGRDVRELLDELVSQGRPIASNRVLAHGRKMFGWAVEEEILPANPFAGIKARADERSRERVLTDEELARLWQAAETVGGISGAFAKVLILTAQRRDEVARMRWADLDFQQQLWTLPREITKSDRSHEVPLSSAAVAVLNALPSVGTHVFTTHANGDRPISGYSKIKERLEKFAKLGADWRFHDLRRTVGTGMARLGVPTSTISRVLNHKEGGVTRIYNRYAYVHEKRNALDQWARKVESLVNPLPDNVVVQLRA